VLDKPKFTKFKGGEMLMLLEKQGFFFIHINGSHHFLRHLLIQFRSRQHGASQCLDTASWGGVLPTGVVQFFALSEFSTRGKATLLDNVKVWEAVPSPKWSARRAAVLAALPKP